MGDLTLLKRQRGGNIGYMKKIIDETNKLLSDEAGNKDEKETQLLSNKEILCEKEDTIRELHETIVTSWTTTYGCTLTENLSSTSSKMTYFKKYDVKLIK